MTKTKKVFRIFWAWQDHKEEKWLNEMARKGWALISYKYLYTFKKIEPTRYIYKLDYKATSDEDVKEYKMIFEETGWEYVTQYGKWHYFRTLENGNQLTEIYTENEFQIEAYKNLLRNLTILLISILIISGIVLSFYRPAFIIGFSTALYFITILCIVKVKQKINKLKV
ncbi:DUF2812 domain-containing protein [Neobacillus thermocopriae]|uniref:DUF2812 domain-containing protein n=1 Tax=Neobacillus thermocopriae TaxID=1215031 RepID=UPI002E1AF3CA|nr:DUF2812 domain-containing protein [Neobacillus thermocopriae]MED3713225.1 DUF2812 domain-containing protein [Neobacillus thermocopriae]